MSLATLERPQGGFDEEPQHKVLVLSPMEVAGQAATADVAWDMLMKRQELIDYDQDHGLVEPIQPEPTEETKMQALLYRYGNPEEALRARHEAQNFATCGDARGPEFLAAHPEAAARAAARVALHEAQAAEERKQTHRRRALAGFALYA